MLIRMYTATRRHCMARHPMVTTENNLKLRTTIKITRIVDSRHVGNLYRCNVHFVVYLSNTTTNARTHTHTRTNIYKYIVFNNLKFTFKHLKRSYMFRSYHHPQGAYSVPC